MSRGETRKLELGHSQTTCASTAAEIPPIPMCTGDFYTPIPMHMVCSYINMEDGRRVVEDEQRMIVTGMSSRLGVWRI